MAIKLGERILKDIYLGDKRIVKAYFGEKLVFEADKPIFVEWIESTAVSYINTEYIMTSDNQEVEIEFQYTNSTGTRVMFGTLPASNRSIHTFTDGTNMFNVYAGQPTSLNYTDFDFTKKHTLYAKAVVGEKLYTELDGEVRTSPSAITTLNKENPWYLFARNDGTNKNINGYFIGRIYRFKMKDNGVVVRDFRPCVHPKTFKACMYDLVTHKYFYNKYSTVFTPAPRFVEYLESDSTAYIDTGISGGNDNLEIDVTFMAQKYVQYGAVYGNYVNEATNTTRVILAYTTSLYSNINCPAGANSIIDTGSSILNKVINFYQDKSKITVNGTDYTVKTRTNGTATNNNIALFNRSLTTPITRDIGLRVYDFKISESGTLLRHLRPCLRGNTPCMYDMVEGQYYMNVGTGTFKYGEIKFVEYLESTGTQWLLTDFYPTIDDEFVVDLQHLASTTDSGGDKMFFGMQQKDTDTSVIYVDQYLPSYRWYVRFATPSSRNKESTIKERTERITITINKNKFTTSEGTELILNDGIALGNAPLTIFNQLSNIGANRCSKLRMWSFYVLRGGSKVLDLRPALDYNNVPCMFDMVTGKYFYNQGTGEFKYGGII